MKALTYVEIDVPYCALTYGVAPCTATLEGETPTGTIKCFNSLGTCQDRENFDDDGATLRFAMPTEYLPADIEAIPSVTGVAFEPGIISLGGDLGQRATMRVTFEDQKHSDTGAGFDKYLSDRDYDPYSQGTFWGKFRARHPYLVGRNLRVIHGTLGQALSDMETRHYIIESFDGPTPEGRYELIAKDVLKLADGDKAQAPRLSSGFLAGAINTSVTAATLSPTGIGDDEYPASGYVTIGGREVCAFTRSGDSLTLTRAQLGTTAASHSAQDRVQICLRYDSDDPADILYDLFVTYAGVPSAYCSLAAWKQETETFLQRLYTGTIAEPTSVKKLVSELIEQAALAVWWDDEAQLVKLQVLRGIQTDAVSFDEHNILADNDGKTTLRTREQPDKRLSQVWTYYGQIDPTKRQDDPDNYRSAAADIDTQAEDDYGSPAIKKIYSRWIPPLGRTVATRLNDIVLGRFKDPPRRFDFELYRYGPESMQLGRGALIGAWPLQDATGAREQVPIQITRLNPMRDRFRIEAEEMRFVVPDDFDNRTIIVESSVNNFNLRTGYDLLYPTPVSGDEVFCIIESGVIVGSTSTSLPAFDVGTWPTGVILNLTVNGRIQGRGGVGGRGGFFDFSGGSVQSPTPGLPGGLAFKTAVAISLDGSGEIFGGAGGGGGGGASLYRAGGGGGGRGMVGADGDAGGPTQSSGGIDWLSGQTGGSGTSEMPGPGGLGGVTNPYNGDRGASGGAGGEAGSVGSSGASGSHSSGAAGGASGNAIDGDSFITESGSLDVRGPRVN